MQRKYNTYKDALLCGSMFVAEKLNFSNTLNRENMLQVILNILKYIRISEQ